MLKRPVPRILVIEDEMLSVMQIEEALDAAGYIVAGIAYTGEEGLRIAEEGKPDLILLDILLGEGMDGFQVAEEIGRSSRIPIVFLTGHSEDDFLERARSLRPAGYILKPFLPEQIRAVVELALPWTGEAPGTGAERRTPDDEQGSLSEALRKKEAQLADAYAALRAVLDLQDRTQKELQEEIGWKLSPMFTRLRACPQTWVDGPLSKDTASYLDQVFSNYGGNLSRDLLLLSTGELRVAFLVREGRTTRDIAALLNLAEETVVSYRKRIRKKLGIKDQKADLSVYLSSLF